MSELAETATEEVAQPPQGETQVNEFDIDKSDNLSQIREHAKSLKEDLDRFKPAHEFITSNGGEETLKQAVQLYSGFTSEDFNPEEFGKFMEELSPERANKLTETVAEKKARELYEKQVSERFGGQLPDEDELKQFNKWRTEGLLGNDDDIPEALKYNEDGSPKSEAELEFLRGIQKQAKAISDKEKALEMQQKEAQNIKHQQEVQQRLTNFEEQRLDVLKKELSNYIKIDENDSPETKQEKALLENFFLNGIAGIFLSNPKTAPAYNSAREHIVKGETLLARRYEADIEKGLLDLARNEGITKLLQSLTQDSKPPQEPRKEFSTPSDSSPQQTGKFDADAKIRELFASGILK